MNVFTTSLDLKVLVAGGGEENIYKLSSTQCRKYLFDIIPSSESFYDIRKREGGLFSIAELIVSNFLSKFSI